MDGANKFVRGDAIAAIVIIVLNILGGFAMGLSKGEDVMKVLQNYTLLTVGEGLVAQIPALLISTAAGLMVTRAGVGHADGRRHRPADFHLPEAPVHRRRPGLSVHPVRFPLAADDAGRRAFWCGIGVILVRSEKQAVWPRRRPPPSPPPSPRPSPPRKASCRCCMWTCWNSTSAMACCPWWTRAAGGDLLDRITMIRQKTAMELGLVIPTVRIRDDLHLHANDYAIKLKGATVASGTVQPELHHAD